MYAIKSYYPIVSCLRLNTVNVAIFDDTALEDESLFNVIMAIILEAWYKQIEYYYKGSEHD